MRSTGYIQRNPADRHRDNFLRNWRIGCGSRITPAGRHLARKSGLLVASWAKGVGRMCFSATASFAAGTVLLGFGAVAIGRVARPAEVPYALIPALFGVQQLIEGGLWLTLPDGSPHLSAILTHSYAFFSHVLWPIFVPLAVLLVEPDPRRRRVLAALAAAGGIAGSYLLYFWGADPTTARVVGDHMLYISPHFFTEPILALYVLGTCVSSLASSHTSVRWFGVAASLSLAAAYLFYAMWFISVWCFFAAIMSVTVLLFFWRPRGTEQQAC